MRAMIFAALCLSFVAGAAWSDEWVSLMPDSEGVTAGTLAGDWRLEGEALVGRAEAGEVAWWRAPGWYWDFELEVEFKTATPGRGGVQYRSHWLPGVTNGVAGPRQMYGYCAIIETRTKAFTGGVRAVQGQRVTDLVDPAIDAHDVVDNKGWNRLSVVTRDGVSEVRINGVTASVMFNEAMIGGLVGLRVLPNEDDAGKISFRNLRIRDLGRVGSWRALFDGETLEGWKKWGTEDWHVTNGEIHGRRGPNESEGYLATIEEWKDFRVRGEFRMLGAGNYGLFYHSRIRLREDGYPLISGVQGEVEPSYPGSTGWHYESYRRGWLIEPDKTSVAAYALRPGLWNTIEIRRVGNRITSWVNGYRVMEWMDRSPQIFEGSFALQLHTGEGAGIDWRELYVEE